MVVTQGTWTIKELVKNKPKINLNPAWQRGPSWRAPRQVLLVDSILRGMDIPKVYLRCLPASHPHSHDAVDGQQRLRAIWEFRSGLLSLDHPDALPPIGEVVIAGHTFEQLPKALRDKFDHFEVSVAQITDATNDEITNLFARLQMGLSLNPAELRNAMMGPWRHLIDSIATSHEFFQDSPIPEARYKRQDFVSHVFAIAANQATKDIKAPDLKRLVAEFAPASKTDQLLDIASAVGDALSVMARIDECLTHRLTQKWLFVDLCWLVMQQQAANEDVQVSELAENFDAFEKLRRKYTGHPESLISISDVQPKQIRLNRLLYAYIVAFRAQGATHANLKIRNAALRAFCI